METFISKCSSFLIILMNITICWSVIGSTYTTPAPPAKCFETCIPSACSTAKCPAYLDAQCYDTNCGCGLQFMRILNGPNGTTVTIDITEFCHLSSQYTPKSVGETEHDFESSPALRTPATLLKIIKDLNSLTSGMVRVVDNVIKLAAEEIGRANQADSHRTSPAGGQMPVPDWYHKALQSQVEALKKRVRVLEAENHKEKFTDAAAAAPRMDKCKRSLAAQTGRP